MKNLQWQYSPKWHLCFHYSIDEIQDYKWYDYVFAIGPLQFRWRGKPWCTRLYRSPEYLNTLHDVLLHDLQTMKYDTQTKTPN